MTLVPDQIEFLRRNRYAIVAGIRKDGRPHQTLVLYALEGDDTLIFSSAGDKSKLNIIRRDPRVSFCVIDEEAHMKYTTVYGTAEFVTDHEQVVDSMMRIHSQTRGEPVPESERSEFSERAKREGRTIVRVKITDSLPWSGYVKTINIGSRERK